MKYSDKLKDVRWQKKRLEILSRDNWTCLICKVPDKHIQVHHIKYIGKDPWDTPSEFLATLCESCHNREHLEDALAKGIQRRCISPEKLSKMSNNFYNK